MQTLNELLNKKIELNIPVDRPETKYERPISYFKRFPRSHELEFSLDNYIPSGSKTVINYYQKLLGWIEANPSITELPRIMEEFYIKPSSDGSESKNVINLEDNFHRFHDFIKDFTPEKLKTDGYITGRKGIGKTYFLNYYLNTKTSELKKENIMWY